MVPFSEAGFDGGDITDPGGGDGDGMSPGPSGKKEFQCFLLILTYRAGVYITGSYGSIDHHGPRVDDIRTEYHPNSGRAPDICHFEDYKPRAPRPSSAPDSEPWHPFRTRADFEFAEVVFKAALSEQQRELLIKIVNSVAAGQLKFTLGSDKELTETWKLASELLTPAGIYL